MEGPHSPMNVFEIIRFHRTSRRLKGHAFWLSLSHNNYSSWNRFVEPFFPVPYGGSRTRGNAFKSETASMKMSILKKTGLPKLHCTQHEPYKSSSHSCQTFACHLPLILTIPTVQINKQTRITKESKWKPFPSGGSKPNRMSETPILLCSSRVLSQGGPPW